MTEGNDSYEALKGLLRLVSPASVLDEPGPEELDHEDDHGAGEDSISSAEARRVVERLRLMQDDVAGDCPRLMACTAGGAEEVAGPLSGEGAPSRMSDRRVRSKTDKGDASSPADQQFATYSNMNKRL